MYSNPTAEPALSAMLTTTLVVDPDDGIRSQAKACLTAIGHEVMTAENAAQALAIVARRRLSCVLLGLELPDASGLELIPLLIEKEPHVAILALGGTNDAQSAALCMQRGAMDYLAKPPEPSILEAAVTRALARRREMIEQAETQAWLQREVVQRGAELRRERTNLEGISVATLEALVNALEAKDPYQRGHSTRVAELSALIAAELGLAPEQVERVRTAGRLHDIGMIGIRESVLGKRGPLTGAEFEHVKTHVTIGAQILAPLVHLRDVIGSVRSHHERLDGTGYPDGLAGDAIPIGARIIGAAEIYDALTTARPYQDTMTPEDAAARMRDLTKSVIHPGIQSALAAVVARLGPNATLDAPGTVEQDTALFDTGLQ